MRRNAGGRPPKPPEEKFVRAPLSLPPDLWEEFKELVPARERSAVAAEALKKEIRRLRRQAGPQAAGREGTASAEAKAAAAVLTPEEEDEQWRQAAERARHYYATDPEAREWAEFAGDTLDYPGTPDE